MQESETELLEMARATVAGARRGGAEIAEVKASAGWELTVKVRLGAPELVQEAGSRALSLRVMNQQKVGMTSTSDLTPAGLARLVDDALELLSLTEADEFAGPAPAELLCSAPHPDLELFDPEVGSVDAARALALATEAERAALDSDERLTLSEGATVSRTTGVSAVVLSSGFEGVAQGSYVSLAVSPVAQDEGGKKRRGHYWAAKRFLQDLEDHREVGRKAAERTLRQLGAAPIATCEAPIVFDPDAGRAIVGLFAGCILGGALWRKASYLVGRLGTPVASELVQIVDDPWLKRGPGSRAYDGEGLRSRRNVIVEGGRLEQFLLDSYSARKLHQQPTASASRRGAGVGASSSNLLFQPGTTSPEEIIASTARGLYVTRMMGFGFNALTGDFSRGAEGFLIEGGKLGRPVAEVTISGNLDSMLRSIDAVGSDLDLRTSIASPTFRVAKMTISGQSEAV